MNSTTLMTKTSRSNATSHAARDATRDTVEKLYATAYHALGQGDSETAQRAFLHMAGIVPFDARAWVGLGASLEQQGKCKQALGVYTFGRSLAPTSIYCKLGCARVWAKLGNHTRAQCELDAAEAHANHQYELQLIDRLRAEL